MGDLNKTSVERATASGFSAQEFRAAMGTFATGVTIVTTVTADGRPVGLTANSFNSVSLDPALVLWSLGVRAGTQPAFRAASHFAVHVLTAAQRGLAERFALRDVDRFADVAWTAGVGGVPLLPDCAAVFECRQRSCHEEGDHLIFVGEVEHCSHRAGVPPLLYHGGRFYTEHPL